MSEEAKRKTHSILMRTRKCRERIKFRQKLEARMARAAFNALISGDSVRQNDAQDSVKPLYESACKSRIYGVESAAESQSTNDIDNQEIHNNSDQRNFHQSLDAIDIIAENDESTDESTDESSEELVDTDEEHETTGNEGMMNDENEDMNGKFTDPEVEELRTWAIRFRIPQSHLTPLLLILRSRLLPSLPKSAKTFLHTQQASYEIEKMNPQHYCIALHKVLIEEVRTLKADVKRVLDLSKTLKKPNYEQAGQGFLSPEFSIENEYETSLPINSIELFQHFEHKLTTERSCLSDTLQVMKRLNSVKLSLSATDILKKFLTRNVAMQYTATKKMRDKFVMDSNTPTFMKCITEALICGHEGITEKEAKSAVGTALTQSKDWDGQRALRTRKESKEFTGNGTLIDGETMRIAVHHNPEDSQSAGPSTCRVDTVVSKQELVETSSDSE